MGAERPSVHPVLFPVTLSEPDPVAFCCRRVCTKLQSVRLQFFLYCFKSSHRSGPDMNYRFVCIYVLLVLELLFF